MNKDSFDHRVSRLERFARSHPRLFIARTLGWVVLAYGYLIAVLFGSAAVCLGLAVVMFFFPGLARLLVIGFFIFGSVFVVAYQCMKVRLKPPLGRQLAANECPKLVELINKMARELDCRPFRRIIITPIFNAGVIDIPRWGLVGPSDSYLQLGLPLMLGTSPEEFQAVLAHELGHCSRQHGRFTNWIYRIRLTWVQAFELMRRKHGVAFGFFNDFFYWFWPHFNAHAFVLSRVNEYEADATANRLAGRAVSGQALIRYQLQDFVLDRKFWPGIFEAANRDVEPPDDLLQTMGKLLKEGAPTEDAQNWLSEALQIETGSIDTHPSLKDRLQPMSIQATLPPRMDLSAAEFYLGGSLLSIMTQVGRELKYQIIPQWRRVHHQANWTLPPKRIP